MLYLNEIAEYDEKPRHVVGGIGGGRRREVASVVRVVHPAAPSRRRRHRCIHQLFKFLHKHGRKKKLKERQLNMERFILIQSNSVDQLDIIDWL